MSSFKDRATEYLGYTPEGSDLIAQMVEVWGTTFQKLSVAEKAWMVYKLGYQIWEEAEGETSDEVEEAIAQAGYELNVKERLIVLEALVAQLKTTCQHIL